MRLLRSALIFTSVLVPLVACQVEATYPQPYAQVQVQTPPPPQVDVNAQVDPNAQPQPDPNAQATDVTDEDPSALSDFHDALAPYGMWVDDPTYGTIWMPNAAVVGSDFVPYLTAGHWTYENDYVWVSDYDWGWAPFHYGRWTTLGPGRGWGWIPGKEYAGAWVTWRNGDDGYGAVGWIPTPPTYYWRGGAPVVLSTPWFVPTYTYVETTNLFVPSIGVRVIRDPVRIRDFEAHTRVYAPTGGFITGAGGVRMRVRGPAPTHLGGIRMDTVPRPPANNASYVRAQQFAHTAQTTHNTTHVTGTTQTGHTETTTHPNYGAANNEHTVHTVSTTSTTTTHPEAHNPNESVTTTHSTTTTTTVRPQPTPTATNRPKPPPSVTHTHH